MAASSGGEVADLAKHLCLEAPPLVTVLLLSYPEPAEELLEQSQGGTLVRNHTRFGPRAWSSSRPRSGEWGPGRLPPMLRGGAHQIQLQGSPGLLASSLPSCERFTNLHKELSLLTADSPVEALPKLPWGLYPVVPGPISPVRWDAGSGALAVAAVPLVPSGDHQCQYSNPLGSSRVSHWEG